MSSRLKCSVSIDTVRDAAKCGIGPDRDRSSVDFFQKFLFGEIQFHSLSKSLEINFIIKKENFHLCYARLFRLYIKLRVTLDLQILLQLLNNCDKCNFVTNVKIVYDLI